MSFKENLLKAKEEFCGRGGYSGNRTVCAYLTVVLCAKRSTKSHAVISSWSRMTVEYNAFFYYGINF